MVRESWNNGSVLAMVDRMFQESVEQYSNTPSEFFSAVEKRFAENLMEFPSLNAKKLAAGQFVRVRCMVQEVRDSYNYKIGCKAVIENCSTARSGFLKDRFEEADTTFTPFGKDVCRHCYTMVPIPGATPWWIDEWNGDMGADTEETARGDVLETTVGKFIAKVSGNVDLQPNSTWDMFGYWSKHINYDDEFSAVPSTNRSELFSLYVISYRSVESPLPPVDTSAASLVRNVLLSSFGDALSAEYLFMNLLSRTFDRPGAGDLPVCSFPLHICGVNNSDNLVAMVKQLMPRVYHLFLTADLLSKQSFAPIINLTTNRMEQGLLQFAAETVLIVDETQLPEDYIPPAADHSGDNLKNLKLMIANQQMEYDYAFHEHPVDVDVTMIIVSKKGSRFFTTPFRIAVAPGMLPTVLGSADDLAQMRLFIQHRRQALEEITLSEVTQVEIHDAGLKLLNTEVKLEDMNAWLDRMFILSRLISSLDGHSELTFDSWHRARYLEKERKETLEVFLQR